VSDWGSAPCPAALTSKGVDALTQPRRQHLPHGGQGSRGRFLDARARPTAIRSATAQRDSLLLVDSSGRHLAGPLSRSRRRDP